MKFECPLCQFRLNDIRQKENQRWAECPNQCVKLMYNQKTGHVDSYLVRAYINDKDYRLASHYINHLNNLVFEETSLSIYKPNDEGQYEFKEIMTLERYFEYEEVSNNPTKFVERLLKMKAFA